MFDILRILRDVACANSDENKPLAKVCLFEIPARPEFVEGRDLTGYSC